MSLFEWLGESRNPGPVGSIDAGSPETENWNPRTIVFRGVLAVVIAVAAAWGIIRAGETAAESLVLALVVIAYCAVAYWVRPRPAFDNVGWYGGLIDHPFRISDDANRALVALSVVLWPGRFLTVSLRDFARYSRGQRVMILPPRE